MKINYKRDRIKKIIIMNFFIIFMSAILSGKEIDNKNINIKSHKIEKIIENKELDKKLEVLIEEKKEENIYSKYISQIKESIEILYYLIFLSVAIATYFSAKKTIFLPLKNEVFKYQIDELEKLYRYLETNKLISGLKSNYYMNIAKIIEDYIEFKNWDNHLIDSEEFYKNIKSAIIFDKHKKEELIFFKSKKMKENKITDWEEYKIKRILITKEFEEEKKVIDSFVSSPFLPSALLIKIKELREQVETLNFGLEDYFFKISKQISLKVSESDNMEDNLDFFYSQLLEELDFQIEIEEKRSEIQKIIRNYLNSDLIFIK